MELIMISFATAFNFAVLRYKFTKGRYLDMMFDIMTMLILNYVLGGTLGGMTIAMMSGAMISIYLLFNPIMFSYPSKRVIKITIVVLTIVPIISGLIYLGVHYV